jgi:Papain-like cysteine protease AvrRpt2
MVARVLDHVPLVSQKKKNSCWAACAAMMLSWKNKSYMPEDEAVKIAGPAWVAKYAADVGLSGNEVLSFAHDFHFQTEGPATFFPVGYDAMLEKHGPLWVGTAINNVGRYSYGHARVLYGIVGDDSGNNTTMYLMDPSPEGTGAGSYKQSFKKFTEEMEAWAKEDQKNGNQNLSPQVFHY